MVPSLDLRPERYAHYYKEEFPARFRDQIDKRCWEPCERLVFEPHTRDAYEEARLPDSLVALFATVGAWNCSPGNCGSYCAGSGTGDR